MLIHGFPLLLYCLSIVSTLVFSLVNFVTAYTASASSRPPGLFIVATAVTKHLL